MSHDVSQDTKDCIAAFEQADAEFKKAYEAFERDHEAALQHIDRLRDDRNAKLDEAKRALRQEAERVPEFRTTFYHGPFKVQKKWSDFYIADKTAAILADRGLYDLAVSSGLVSVRVEVASYDQFRAFLEDRGVAKDFECCEDGVEHSTAVGGPKPIPPLGAELKKE